MKLEIKKTISVLLLFLNGLYLIFRYIQSIPISIVEKINAILVGSTSNYILAIISMIFLFQIMVIPLVIILIGVFRDKVNLISIGSIISMILWGILFFFSITALISLNLRSVPALFILITNIVILFFIIILFIYRKNSS